MMPTLVRQSTAAMLGFFVAACGLLEVSDPTAIEEPDLANAEGADLLRRQALGQLSSGVARGALYGGVIADELMVDAPIENVAAGIRTAVEMLIDARAC